MRKHFILLIVSFIYSSVIFAQRNAVLIIADDIGTDYFGFYEDAGDTVDLPNIRAMLAKGVRFKNAMSNPVCSSTRAGMLTGRYSFRTGVGNIVGSTAGSGTLDTAELTLPRLLTNFNSNIVSANIGKWHLHNPNPVGNLLFPNVLGYAHFEGPFIGALPSYTNWTKYVNGTPTTVTNYATSENVNNAVSWLKTIPVNHPFFLWLAFNAPHSPFHLPPLNLHSYTTLSGTAQHIQQNPKLYFKAALQALDTEIGRLFDSLQVLNKLDSTDFIFVGDNGNATATAQIANLNRAKGTVYQYGVHVPLIIAGPSVSNPGRASDALVNTHDIFATVIELMGDTTWKNTIPVNKPVDSKSMLPILKNQVDSIRPWSFCEMFKNTPDADDAKAIRNKSHKLIRFDAGGEEFYHLQNDPDELTNLLGSALNFIDSTNYLYLCTEMNNLLGNSTSCNFGTGITKNLSDGDFYVYPNPAGNYVSIKSKFPITQVQLFNAQGDLIDGIQSFETIDFSDIPSGLYFIQAFSNTKLFKTKIIHLN